MRKYRKISEGRRKFSRGGRGKGQKKIRGGTERKQGTQKEQ